MSQAIERKSIELKELSAESPGSFTGYPSKFYDVDSYGDVVLPGAFKATAEEFLKRGFTAHSHDWGYEGVIGYPVSAEEDSIGFRCVTEFHSTPDAQNVRTKAMERLKAGKQVFLSIGFITRRALDVAPDEYDSVLPAFLPADRIEAIKAAAPPWGLRLVMEIELFEYSIVTAPALRSAEVLEVRSEPVPTPPAGVRFTEELIAARAAARAAVGAAERARDINAKRREERAGRAISAARRQVLQECYDALSEACGVLKDVLDETAPNEDEPKNLDAALLEQSLRFQNFRARALPDRAAA